MTSVACEAHLAHQVLTVQRRKRVAENFATCSVAQSRIAIFNLPSLLHGNCVLCNLIETTLSLATFLSHVALAAGFIYEFSARAKTTPIKGPRKATSRVNPANGSSEVIGETSDEGNTETAETE